MYSTDHIILRDIEANGRVGHRIERKPVRVATMLNEKLFTSLGNCLVHNTTVFLEDSVHDWYFVPLDRANPNGPGDFCYYTRIALRADVLLVFALSKTPPADVQTGQPVVAS